MKSKQILQLVLLAAGIILVTYGVARGEAAVVLSKAIKLCLECVGIGYENNTQIKENRRLAWLDSGGRHLAYKYTCP